MCVSLRTVASCRRMSSIHVAVPRDRCLAEMVRANGRLQILPHTGGASAASKPADAAIGSRHARCRADRPQAASLARRITYRLMGINRLGFNAFFVRHGEGEAELSVIPVEDCFSHPKVKQGIHERFPVAANLPWQKLQ